MNFYARYESICQARGIEPCSQSTADLLKVTKATISSWKTKYTSPKGETVGVIADALHTSADFLLGRTDDPAEIKPAKPASKVDKQTEQLLRIYARLDETDRIKAVAYLEGLLAGDKYEKVGSSSEQAM